MLLHGPAHYPRYYGQLERQNREHRAYLERGGASTTRQLAVDLKVLQETMNTKWPRASLGWCTAEAAWRARPALDVDRAALRDEVRKCRDALLAHATTARQRDRAERHSIEHVLISRGFLRRQSGGHC
jgi:hypothetical protein